MSKKRPNRFDVLFDSMLSTDKAVKDFATLGESPYGMEVATFLLTKYLELQGLEVMYQQKLLPALIEGQRQNIREAKYSRYREFLHFTPEPTEDIEEWIRYGYVQLFHKYESFHKGLIRRVDGIFEGLFDDSDCIAGYIKKKYDFEITDQWRIHPVVREVNYVNVSIKHYDGYPKQPQAGKDAIPRRFKMLDPARRISIPPKEFYEDIEQVMEWERQFAQVLLVIQQLRTAESLLKDETAVDLDQVLKDKIQFGRLAVANMIDSWKHGT